MRRGRDQAAAVLKWYPAGWRQRYGEELAALMEDSLGARRATPRLRLSMARAGLRERLHEGGLIGDHQPAAERLRAGSLLVLGAWTAFVVAGASFSKASEHFARAASGPSGGLPRAAFDAVVALGVVGATLVVLGTVAAGPAFVRFLGGGGWSVIRRHVLRAAVLSVVTAGAVVPLSFWAHHLDVVQRNGGDTTYSAFFVAWALLGAATLAQWTAAAVAAGRRIDLTRRALHLESSLAVAVTGAMAVMTLAAALWWEGMAHAAPWFLQGTRAGTRPSAFTIQLVLTLALMTAATTVAGFGVGRISRARAESCEPHE